MFSGTVIRLGEKLGVDTPVNRILYHGIKVLEAKIEK
jgi:ketopantoate reductase